MANVQKNNVFLTEIVPLSGFFLAYKFSNIIIATLTLLLLSMCSMLYKYYQKQEISKVMLFTNIVLALSLLLTLLSGNANFIKMKPTLVNGAFAVMLLGGCYFRQGLIKHIFANVFTMSEDNWLKLSKVWAGYFIFMASLNEFIWRNYTEAVWVNFKVFGLLPMMLLFAICQYPFIKQHAQIIAK